MNRFESICIITGNISEKEYKKFAEEVKKYFNKFEIEAFEELGIKNLAYEVKGNKKGYYLLVRFRATNEKIHEIENYYRKEEKVIKYITIRINEED